MVMLHSKAEWVVVDHALAKAIFPARFQMFLTIYLATLWVADAAVAATARHVVRTYGIICASRWKKRSTVCKQRSMFQHLSLAMNVMAVVPKVVQNPQPAQHVQEWVKFVQHKGSLRLNVPVQHVRVPVRSLKTHANPATVRAAKKKIAH